MKCLFERLSPLPGEWLLDSGGFTEIEKHGRYTFSESEYIQVIERTQAPFAFCMDWMCEEVILNRTGKDVPDHQLLTFQSFLSLQAQMGAKILPVLQGISPMDYVHHLKMYKSVIGDTPTLFGVGSICKRQSVSEIENIVSALITVDPKIKLHGFGVKTRALRSDLLRNVLHTADSMAWSFGARKGDKPNICNCQSTHCGNCLEFALLWRKKLLCEMGFKQYYPKLLTHLLPHERWL